MSDHADVRHRLPDKVAVGISQCLLGDHVRYDGGHKRSPFCTEVLGRIFDFVPVCPEMGIGMGAPREPIHLVGGLRDDALRALGKRNPALDVTAALRQYGRDKAAELAGLCGYIFISRSPSCGLGSTPVHDANGVPLNRRTHGLYAREFTRHHPLLPVEEESRLRDPRRLDHFLTRVYAWRRWQALEASGLTLAALQDFHVRHKYLLLAHSPAACRYLSRLLALAPQRPIRDVAGDYGRSLMAALGQEAGRQAHGYALRQLAGHLKRALDPDSRRELAALIEDYHRGRVPLDTPRSLLRRHLDRHPHPLLRRQVYLQPYPPGLLPDNNG